jgi:hypothetical protein
MLAFCLMECVLRHWLMPAGLLQFEVVAHVVSRCMHSMFLTADTRSFKDSLSRFLLVRGSCWSLVPAGPWFLLVPGS